MKRFTLVTLLVVLAMLATIGSVLAAESRSVYRAGLSGQAAGTGSDAHGNAVFTFKDDGSSLKFKLVVNGLDDTTMAHIHVAPASGVDGPPVLWLYPEGAPPSLIEGTFNGLLAGRTVTSADLTGAGGISSLSELMEAIEQGRAYVNVHSSAFPAGEIRGAID